MLYFGYTNCPDICPATMADIGDALRSKPASLQEKVTVVFVSTDVTHDTGPVIARWLHNFDAGSKATFVGLRGTPDALASLARRFRVAYSVTPAHDGKPYEVTHSAIIYVFDQNGDARLLISSMATQKPDIDGTTADLRTLIAQNRPPGLIDRILRIV